MHLSGKILACCSTALSVAAGLGVAALFAMQNPALSRPALAVARTLQGSSHDSVADGSSPPPTDQAKSSGPDLSASDSSATEPAPQTPPSGATEIADAPPPPSDDAVVPPSAQWSDREIEAALMECMHLLAPLTADVVPLAPIRNASCGTPAPVLLRSIGAKEKVIVDPPLLINCPMVAALNRWLEKTVQPAAHAAFGVPVAHIIGSSYACRNRYNLPNDRLSQHAFANAIDLPLFALADGRRIDIAQGWGPTRRDLVALAKAAAKAKLVAVVAKETPIDSKAEKIAPAEKEVVEAEPKGDPARLTIAVKASGAAPAVDVAEAEPKAATPAPDPLSTPQAKFLRRVHQGACETFSTVLGPEANDVHRTHLHLDLQDRNSLNVCE
jgi:hypothetical protein